VVVVLFNAGDQVPETPLLEVVGNAVIVALAQEEATCVNVGVTIGFTVIVIVAVLAHIPAVGVNVYSVVAKLFNAGDQIPVMPFVEVVGKAIIVAPEQIGATPVNAGVTIGFTVMVIVAVLAHNPAVGVKVYCVVAVLFNAGNQVPVMPFVEVVGKAFNVAPEQIAATCVNVGVTFGFTIPLIAILLVVAPVEAQVIFPAGVPAADDFKRT
jgi:hypothetical protein